jgi:hypothetical protein
VHALTTKTLAMYKSCFGTILLLLISVSAVSQAVTDDLLKKILSNNTDDVLRKVLQQPDSFRLQIIYTEINRDHNNKPAFKNHYFNYDPQLYFNPASLVKLPLAVLSLEKLNTLKIAGVDKYTTIQFDSRMPWQKPLLADTTAASNRPSIAHFIKRALLISENDPYNRMYQFVGQQEINRNLKAKGYGDTRITRQFLGLTPEQNRHTNAIRFLDSNNKLLYYQPPARNDDVFDFSRKVKIGNAHYDRNDSLVHTPFDFTVHNFISLKDMQQLLQSVMFPASIPQRQRFNLTEDDYKFLYRYLSQYPSETADPKYDTSVFYDSYVKFFFRDSTREMPPHVRVFNKVGWSYGFISDVSYVVDVKNNVEFMLAATLYVNSDGIINDGKYDYKTIGYPFLYQLGQTIYKHELTRDRKYNPDLSSFKLVYEKRDPGDTRASLKDVDN